MVNFLSLSKKKSTYNVPKYDFRIVLEKSEQQQMQLLTSQGLISEESPVKIKMN